VRLRLAVFREVLRAFVVRFFFVIVPPLGIYQYIDLLLAF
jgi:hypothetical protein